jgi:hypothetical protein
MTTRTKGSKARLRAPQSSRPGHVPVTSDEKLMVLLDTFRMTSPELALILGCSLRAIELRRTRLRSEPETEAQRKSKLDGGIDGLHSLATMLRNRSLEPDLIRAWFLGRSAYLDEQRPATLLCAGHFELVRAAAIAFARCEPPQVFVDRYGPIPRITSPVTARHP